MSVFEVLVIEHPTVKDKEEHGAEERVVLGPIFVVAKDASAAGFRVVMECRSEMEAGVDIKRVEVLVRPF